MKRYAMSLWQEDPYLIKRKLHLGYRGPKTWSETSYDASTSQAVQFWRWISHTFQ